ncbi:MAG: hypothetical protein BWY06_02606 [Candidatus Latescibacteria bacterium ADurb.Bin168]|nr:MAG: hypothetical protein BWY06_02606 [Candidatus Latescibacteria bacterium ADurb.Bin168]
MVCDAQLHVVVLERPLVRVGEDREQFGVFRIGGYAGGRGPVQRIGLEVVIGAYRPSRSDLAFGPGVGAAPVRSVSGGNRLFGEGFQAEGRLVSPGELHCEHRGCGAVLRSGWALAAGDEKPRRGDQTDRNQKERNPFQAHGFPLPLVLATVGISISGRIGGNSGQGSATQGVQRGFPDG